MTTKQLLSLLVFPVVAIFALPSTPAHAQDQWEFTLSPYGWMAGMDGTAGVGGFTADVDVEFENILENLDVGLMVETIARKGRFGFLSDIVYVKLSAGASTRGPLFSGAEAELEQFTWSLSGMYRLVENDRGFLEVLAGTRFVHIDSSLAFRPGILAGRTLDGDKGWWDGVGGLRGRYWLNDKLFAIAHADIGVGGSDLTWQLFGGVGYTLCETTTAILGYRHLDYDYQDGGFVYDIATSGLMLGVSFQW